MKLKIKFTSDLARQIYEKREKPLAWKEGDSSMDLSYVGDAPITVMPGKFQKIGSGFSAQLADVNSASWETQIRPRSGLGSKGIHVALATMDFGYIGEYWILLYNFGEEPFVINPGDRIAQFVVTPIAKPVIEFVETLDETNRGAKGIGSSGI